MTLCDRAHTAEYGIYMRVRAVIATKTNSDRIELYATNIRQNIIMHIIVEPAEERQASNMKDLQPQSPKAIIQSKRIAFTNI